MVAGIEANVIGKQYGSPEREQPVLPCSGSDWVLTTRFV